MPLIFFAFCSRHVVKKYGAGFKGHCKGHITGRCKGRFKGHCKGRCKGLPGLLWGPLGLAFWGSWMLFGTIGGLLGGLCAGPVHPWPCLCPVELQGLPGTMIGCTNHHRQLSFRASPGPRMCKPRLLAPTGPRAMLGSNISQQKKLRRMQYWSTFLTQLINEFGYSVDLFACLH